MFDSYMDPNKGLDEIISRVKNGSIDYAMNVEVKLNSIKSISQSNPSSRSTLNGIRSFNVL